MHGYGQAASASRSYVISVGVHVYVCGQKKCESHFSDQLTFSNTCGRLLVEFID